MPWLIHDGKTPRVALYTRCEDELLARAELLVLAEEALEKRKGIAVYGYYDVDPSLYRAVQAHLQGRPQEVPEANGGQR